MSYEFTDEMGEISGFGGGYEETCRMMLRAGMEWWDAHPQANPVFKGFRNVFGLITEENDDARALTAAIEAGAGEGGCTGAMHQAVVNACMFIKGHGWPAYVEEMKKRPPSGVQSPPRGCSPREAYDAGLAIGKRMREEDEEQ